MASSIGAGRTRMVLWVVFAVLVLLVVIDGGSISLARMQVGDDAQQAARAGANAIVGQPVNNATAEVAYGAAVQGLTDSHDSIEQGKAFIVGGDGSVTLTVVRTAPTLLAKYLPPLKGLTQVHATYTQEKIGY